MRFFISVIMMFLFISSSREFIELSKLPLLIGHYKKHKTENGPLSLMDFLKQHYTTETENDNDDNEDNQLPFKNIFDNHLTTIYLPANEACVASVNIISSSLLNSGYSDGKPFDVVLSVFHPPC